MSEAAVRADAPEGPWTVLKLTRWSAGYLEEKGVAASQARLDAEYLLAHVLGTNRLQLYLQFDRPLTPEELGAYKPLLLRRAAREPLQYILGRSAFRELDLRVDPRVLIPRPETEELVQAVLEWARRRAGVETTPGRGTTTPSSLPWSSADEPADGTPAGTPDGAGDASGGGAASRPTGVPEPAPATRSLTALDVGTGSGCIALSLALEGPFERVVATDVSADATELAEANAREADLQGRVEVRCGPLFEPVPGERFDVVVSNPPYVARRDAGTLEPEVRDHEPAEALFGGDDGTDVLERLVEGAAGHLVPGGLLALEVGLGQTGAVAGLVRAGGAFAEPEVRRDLSGRPRMVLAERLGDRPRPDHGSPGAATS